MPADTVNKHLLEDPKTAFEVCFGNEQRPINVSDKDWKNHQYSTKAVCLEICAIANGSFLFDLLTNELQQ